MEHSQPSAGALYARRRQRQEFFGAFADLFADPAWDILLLLSDDHGIRETAVLRACAASQVPKATALRILTNLESRGLIRRFVNPRDYRSKLVELTEAGLGIVDGGLAVGAD